VTDHCSIKLDVSRCANGERATISVPPDDLTLDYPASDQVCKRLGRSFATTIDLAVALTTLKQLAGFLRDRGAVLVGHQPLVKIQCCSTSPSKRSPLSD
jgi:hypothetical protein